MSVPLPVRCRWCNDLLRWLRTVLVCPACDCRTRDETTAQAGVLR